MSLTKAAKALRKQIRSPKCTDCALSETAQYVCLTGNGPVPAKAMLIGEAPGMREEEDQEPFVGKAGQYLDEVMEKYNLNRDDVFISNAVKCRPPGNDTPSNSQIKACSSYLKAEIEAVNPKHIMVLGNPAMAAVTIRKAGVTKFMGTWTKARPEFGDRDVFINMHPSGVLHQQHNQTKFEFCIKQFSNIIGDNTSKVETDYQLVRTRKQYKQAIREIRSAEVIAWDIENSGGFNPHNGGEILVLGVATRPGKVWVFPYKHPQLKVKNTKRIIKDFKKILEADKPRKVAHNGKYERKWALRYGIDPKLHFDTIIAAYLLDENGPMGLKPLARTLCKAPVWDEDIDWDKGIPPLKDLWPYNAADCDYTLRLYHVLRKRINAIPALARFMKFLMIPASDILADIEYTGIALDRDKLNERFLQCDEEIFKISKKLEKYIPKKVISKDRKGQACVVDEDFGTMPINWNSTKFLGWFLYKLLDLPLMEVTKTGKPGTREAVLVRIASKHKAAGLLLEYREWQGRKSKFLGPWIDRAFDYGDGGLILYPNYNLTKTDQGKGTETGRLSGDMQQVPRESYCRNIVTARPGWKFGEVDFSQVELRIAAWFAKEERMIAMFRNGEDIHRFIASRASRIPIDQVDKQTRKKGKAVAFGYLYGMREKKYIMYAKEKFGIEVTMEEARVSRREYFAAFPRLLDWHEEVRHFVAHSGYVKSPFGRRRRLPHIRSQDRSLVAQAERQAINAPVQSTASDLCLFSGALLKKRLSPDIYRPVGFMHDAILFEYKEDHEKEVKRTIKEVMENLPTYRYFGFKIPVPIVAEVETGDYWRGIDQK